MNRRHALRAGAAIFGLPWQKALFAAAPPLRPLQKFPVRVRNDRVEIYTAPIPYPGFHGAGKEG